MLASTIQQGAATRDFFGTANGQQGDKFEGFQLGEGMASFSDTLLLLEPETADRYDAELKKQEAARRNADAVHPAIGTSGQGALPAGAGSRPSATPPVAAAVKSKLFRGTADVAAPTAKMKLVQIADEIIKLLVADPNAIVRVTLEIQAEFPQGVSDTTKRAVSENANSLNFRVKEWE